LFRLLNCLVRHTSLRFAAFGLMFGIVVWRFTPLSLTAAVIMCMASAWSMLLLKTLTETHLYPRFARYSRGTRLALQLTSSLAAHSVGWFVPILLTGAILDFSPSDANLIVWFIVVFVVVVTLHSFRLTASFYRELREKDALEERLRTLATQAELRALKAQINPHFLFNSLNTIASLIASDPVQAEKSVEQLASVFRYALSSSEREFVTLGEELGFVKAYLEIEKARFGDRLVISRSVSPDLLDTPIPSLVLQPLVENSVKHGRGEDGTTRLSIGAVADDTTVRIEIRDEGAGMPEPVKAGLRTDGTGLRNVGDRLRMIYGEGYGLKLEDNSPRGALAVVTVPRAKK